MAKLAQLNTKKVVGHVGHLLQQQRMKVCYYYWDLESMTYLSKCYYNAQVGALVMEDGHMMQ